jgi:hypothetical protein
MNEAFAITDNLKLAPLYHTASSLLSDVCEGMMWARCALSLHNDRLAIVGWLSCSLFSSPSPRLRGRGSDEVRGEG